MNITRDLGTYPISVNPLILDDEITRLLLTSVSLAMVSTPFLEDMRGEIAKKLE